MTKKKRNLYIIVAILATSSLLFRLISDVGLEQTSLIFVGIPTFITLLLIKYVKTPKSAYQIAFYTITLFFLFSSILLGEGLVCIIFMAPIFYGVAALIIFIVSLIKKSNKNKKLYSFIIIPVFLLTAQINEIGAVSEVHTIDTTIQFQENYSITEINKQPNFLTHLPNFFKMGFPKPISIEGSGIEIGDSRKINFESSTKGIGTLHIKIIDKTINSLTFKVIENSTHLNHWMTFKEFSVKINNDNSIIWSSKFTCDLGPKWYFEPLEKYAVNMMNQHLINSFFN